ncbi:MAG: methyltransferase domain-containing protein [Myxococcales bacterium]|nr:methyltransferase domain-containing protein [Myxococcales bacterium]
MDHEGAVKGRYSEAARAVEANLCCPTSYDSKLLAAIPEVVLERDYGCGNPTAYLKPGETVLDLGAGSGKVCFLAAQVVGPSGKVIGVDMNEEMLALARGAAPEVVRRIGFSNVAFKKARIQDLSVDLEEPGRPLFASDSVDAVISSCVLNLVRPEDKRGLFAEMFRVLRRGGRAIISDIVSDEEVPDHLKSNPDLWTGCISGAFREDLFLLAFEEAGFHGVTLSERQAEPWRTVEGIEFRSVTVLAYKGKQGPCIDQKHAVVYRGPFREVRDDEGHLFRRGARTAVCEKTFRLLTSEPYRGQFEPIPPRVLEPLEQCPPFPCGDELRLRDPSETKGQGYRATTEANSSCGPGGSCC